MAVSPSTSGQRVDALKTEIIGLPGQGSTAGRGNGGKPQRPRRGADPARIYAKVVERYAMLFDRPEARLRFLNNTLNKQIERHEQLQDSLQRFRFLEHTKFYDWVLEGRVYSTILEELTTHLPANRQHVLQKLHVPFSARAFFLFHQARPAFYALGVLAAGLLLFGLYSLASFSARGVNSFLTQRYGRGINKIIRVESPGTALGGTPAKFLPGYKPEKVWLVEQNGETERYSNGCRILKTFETNNYPRAYYALPRGYDTTGEGVRRDIVGIVYHTSESDIVPFIQNNNDAIQKRSHGLLEYIRDKKSYNYVIDRYGETYRVVRDDQTAFHAGNSIWADEKNTYVVLNDSFLGICFESTASAGSLEETLTEAQIIAGRALTNVLRSRYNIDDANCTTHGIVSVNPDKMLIAFHHDWTRNFPFEAMGLSDKYKVMPPNMLDYGFGYDDEILTKLSGRLWEGAVAAEEEFRQRAEKAHINPELLKRKMRDRYLAQRERARALRLELTGAGKDALAGKAQAESSSAETGNR